MGETIRRRVRRLRGIKIPTGRLLWRRPWDARAVPNRASGRFLWARIKNGSFVASILGTLPFRRAASSTEYFFPRGRDGILAEINEFGMRAPVGGLHDAPVAFHGTPAWGLFSER